VNYLFHEANQNIASDETVSIKRIGKRISDKPRPLKIELSNIDLKYRVLNNRKNISTNPEILNAFHNKIFVNLDTSFLVRNEEFRLRKKLKELKNDDPLSSSYIRSGSLYSNGILIDKIDICKQLF
jgi:hypothetical protein